MSERKAKIEFIEKKQVVSDDFKRVKLVEAKSLVDHGKVAEQAKYSELNKNSKLSSNKSPVQQIYISQ